MPDWLIIALWVIWVFWFLTEYNIYRKIIKHNDNSFLVAMRGRLFRNAKGVRELRIFQVITILWLSWNFFK